MKILIQSLFLVISINIVKANELECTLYHDTGEVYLTYAYELPDHIEYLKKYVGTETWSSPTTARKACSQYLEHYELEKDLVEIDYHCDVAHPVEYKVFGLNIINKVTKHKETLLLSILTNCDHLILSVCYHPLRFSFIS